MITLIPSFLVLNIPAGISLIVIVGLFIASIAEFRQGHIGRISIFLNALLLWEIFYNSWVILPNILKVYLNLGSVFGMIAIITYLPRIRLPTEFYKISFVLYGSLSLIIAIFGAIYFKIPLF